MKNTALLLILLLFAVPAMATITWEAHYNNGNNSADYAASGVVTAWSGQDTTPWVSNGYTGGAVAPSTNPILTNLNYALGGNNVNVNLLAGSLTVRVKPNFDSTAASNSGTVICVAGSYSEDRRRFLNLYYNAGVDKWVVALGRLTDSPSPTVVGISSDAVSFSAGDWIQLGFTWERSTGNVGFFVNGVEQTPANIGADYWAISGGYLPWALTVGNVKSAGSAPYGGQFDGLIDDVVFSDVYKDMSILPEPATITLLVTGLGLAIVRRRR